MMTTTMFTNTDQRFRFGISGCRALLLLVIVGWHTTNAQWMPVHRFERHPFAAPSFNRPTYLGGQDHHLADMQFHGIVEDSLDSAAPGMHQPNLDHHNHPSTANLVEEALEYDPNNERNPWNSETAPLPKSGGSQRRHRRRPRPQGHQRFIQPTIRTLAENSKSPSMAAASLANSQYAMYKPRPNPMMEDGFESMAPPPQHQQQHGHFHPESSLSSTTKYGASAVSIGDASIGPMHGHSRYRIEAVDEMPGEQMRQHHHAEEPEQFRHYAPSGNGGGHRHNLPEHSPSPPRYRPHEEYVGEEANGPPSSATDNFVPQAQGFTITSGEQHHNHRDPHNHGGYVSGTLMSTPAMATSNYEDDPIDYSRFTRVSGSNLHGSRMHPAESVAHGRQHAPNHFVIGRYRGN